MAECEFELWAGADTVHILEFVYFVEVEVPIPGTGTNPYTDLTGILLNPLSTTVHCLHSRPPGLLPQYIYTYIKKVFSPESMRVMFKYLQLFNY